MWTLRDLGILYAAVVVLAAVIAGHLGYELARKHSTPREAFLSG